VQIEIYLPAMTISQLCSVGAFGGAALFYTEQRALQLPALLMRMQMRACTALEDSKAAAETARVQLQRKGLSDAQVRVRQSCPVEVVCGC